MATQGEVTLITPQERTVPVGEGASLGDVLSSAGEQRDFDRETITLNGLDAHPSDPVKPGDEIVVYP